MIGFILLAAIMIAGAIGVITLRQPVHAALSLVATLLTLAVTYITLEAHFLGAIQVIVYAGAIMVLFLFVIMLLNIGEREAGKRFPGLRPAVYLAALGAAAVIAVSMFQEARPLPSPEVIEGALAGGGADRVGESLFGNWVLAFQLVGILLLTGIIGAVGLVQRTPEKPVAPEVGGQADRELETVG